MGQKIIDLTHRYKSIMPVHEYDEPPKIEKMRNLENHKYNDWRLTTGMHVGTHIDGPGHLSSAKTLMADIPADHFVGAGFLVDARGKETIDASLLASMPEQEGLIVLIMMGMDTKFGTKEYFTKHPVITQNFAKKLIERKVIMVGLDFFSPDHYPFPIHDLLLAHDILIIENLIGLEQLLGIKDFTVAALPLKLETDSALARVIAIISQAVR